MGYLRAMIRGIWLYFVYKRTMRAYGKISKDIEAFQRFYLATGQTQRGTDCLNAFNLLLTSVACLKGKLSFDSVEITGVLNKDFDTSDISGLVKKEATEEITKADIPTKVN